MFAWVLAGEGQVFAASGHFERVEVDADVGGTEGGGVAVVGGAVLVGACEGVDDVVVFAVGEGGELVEEGLGVAAVDELDEPVFGGGGDGPGAGGLVAGRAVRVDDVAL